MKSPIERSGFFWVVQKFFRSRGTFLLSAPSDMAELTLVNMSRMLIPAC
jgi:hypothetical protein